MIVCCEFTKCSFIVVGFNIAFCKAFIVRQFTPLEDSGFYFTHTYTQNFKQTNE